MANLKQTIEFQAKGLAKLKKQYKELEGRTKGLEGATGKAGGGLKGLGKAAGIAGAAFFAGRGIISGLTNSIQLASKFQGVSRGFDNLAKSAGFSSAAFEKFQDATDNTISSVDLMTQANNAMLLGIADSEDQMAELFDVGQRLAQGLGQDTAYGIESLVTGLGRQSKLMLDNLGIMLDVNKANDDYATKLGKTASDLTDAERKQAFVNAAMEEGRRLVEKMGEEQLTMASSMDQAKSAISDVGVEIGITLAPAVASIASGFSGAASAVANYIKNLRLSTTAITETTTAEEKEEILLARIARKKDEIRDSNKVGARDEREQAQQQADLLALELELVEAVAKRKDEELSLTLKNIDATKLQAEAEQALAEVKNVETADLGAEDFDQFIRQQQERADAMFVEAEMLKELQIQYPLLAEQLGLVNEENKKASFFTGENLKLTQSFAFAAKGASQINQKASHANALVAKRAAQLEAIVNTASAVTEALPNIPLSIAMGALGAIQIAKIESAAFAKGTDQVITQPTLALMGEKGAEHVQVTPLNPTMQQNSPKGGTTVNISGGVIDDDFIRNELIPALNSATATGSNLNA